MEQLNTNNTAPSIAPVTAKQLAFIAKLDPTQDAHALNIREASALIRRLIKARDAANGDAPKAGKTTQKKAEKAPITRNEQAGVKVGDIFYFCYGYDATLYVFYQVISFVSETKIIIRRVQPRIKSTTRGPGLDWSTTFEVRDGEILPPFRGEKDEMRFLKKTPWNPKTWHFKAGFDDCETNCKLKDGDTLEEDNYH